MGANHGERISCFPFLADTESDDGRSVSCKVVLSAGNQCRVPAISFFDFLESGGLEALDSRVYGMIC
jgi:hypothetical protein